MFALDLFNTDHERRLTEGAVDQLEQRRIDDLAIKMDDLVARAKQATTPEAKVALVKEFQKCKAERDNYFKIKDECMGYGTLVGEADAPVQKPSKSPWDYVKGGAPNKSIGQDLVTPQQRVAGATPPSNTVAGKAKSTFSSFVDWLAGRDDTGPTYESAVAEQTSAASPVTSAKYAYEQMRKAFEDNVDIATIRWMGDPTPVTMSRNQLFHTLAKLKSMSRQNRNQFALQTLANRSNFYLWLGSQKKVQPRPALKQPKDPLQPELPLNKPTPGIPSQSTPVQERAQKKNSEDPEFGDVETANTVRKIRAKYPAARSDVEALAKDEIANQEKTNKTISDLEAVNARQDAALKQARALDSQQGNDLDNVEQQIDQLSQRLQLIKTAKPVAGRPTSNAPKITKQPAKAEPKTTEPIPVPVATVNPELEKKIDDLNKAIENLPKGADPRVENDLQVKLARAEDLLKDYQKVAATQAEKQPDVLGAADQAQQQLAKSTQKSVSQPRNLNLKPRAPSGDRDLKPTFKAKPNTKTTPPKTTPVPNPEDEFDLLDIDESADQLHTGDPIVVTAPNEFEGKTGEIYELSPSGTFVIVNLYNHGKHSMHMSDIKYNDYADQEEADDWYDEMDESTMSELDAMRQDYERLKPAQFKAMYGIDPQVFFQKYRTLLKPAAQQDAPVKEGFQDFNKVEPYAVCLAGKPVKKFDYYEEARRFHDNWKKKLYREGNKEKADKITLMPLNLDEMDSRGHTGTRDDYEKDRKYKGPVGTGKPATSKKVVKDLSNDFEKAFDKEKEVKEAGNPAQQAAIAIAMKKAHKKPKQVDELDANTLKSYADKRGAQVAAMKANNPDPVAGSKEWIQQAVPAQQVNLAKRKIARKERQGVEEATADQFGQAVRMASQTGKHLEKDPETHREIRRTAQQVAQRQKNIERKQAGYGNDPDEYADLDEAAEIRTKEDFVQQRDKLYRMIQLETDPANKQILKTAIRNLERRAAEEGWFKLIREENSTSSEAVEIAIIRRVLVAHTDLIMEFGLDKVTQAIEEVAYNVGDVDEIGSSDVSAWIHQVKQILGASDDEQLDEKWSQKYKRSINCSNPKGFSQKAHCAGRKK